MSCASVVLRPAWQARSRRKKKRRPVAEEPFFDRGVESAAFATTVQRAGLATLLRELFDVGRAWQRHAERNLDTWLDEDEDVTIVDGDSGSGGRGPTSTTSSQSGRHGGDSDDDDVPVTAVRIGSGTHLRRSSTRMLFEGGLLLSSTIDLQQYGNHSNVFDDGNSDENPRSQFYRPEEHTALFDKVPWEKVDLGKFLANVDIQDEAKHVLKHFRSSYGLLRQVGTCARTCASTMSEPAINPKSGPCGEGVPAMRWCRGTHEHFGDHRFTFTFNHSQLST